MPREFDLCTSEIVGRYLIEASAGTGKTYSLEHLVVRFLVELNVPIDRILIVTFTKAATAEIRERVRQLLRKMSKTLSANEPLTDSTEAQLVQMWKSKGWEPLERIHRALDGFDDASVQTIHSFCQKMLSEFNFTRGGAYDLNYGTDPGFADAVVEEFIRCKAPELPAEAALQMLEWKSLGETLKKYCETEPSIEAVVFPEDDVLDNEKATEEQQHMQRVLGPVFKSFIQYAPKRMKELQTRAGFMSFSTLLTEMHRLVHEAPTLVERIRARFDAVLIDEFQDTDSIQYGIFKTLFLPEDKTQGPASVFFVGDPKQAIYGFRMAELATYLKARDDLVKADSNALLELKRNFRSTPGIVSAVNAYFNGVDGKSAFLNPKLEFHPTLAGSGSQPLVRKVGDKLHPLPVVSFWMNPPTEDAISADDARAFQARRVAEDIALLLAKGDVWIKRDAEVNGCRVKSRPLKAGDIAILVRKRNNASLIMDELSARGIRSMLQEDRDVFDEPEALEIAALLEAMVDPFNRRVLNTARATRLFGRTMHEIRDAADTLGVQDRALVEECAQRCQDVGPAAAFMHLMRQTQTEERLLPVNGGLSVLENYSQIVEILQQHFIRIKTLGGLQRWYAQELTSKKGDTADERKVRTVSDENVVRIETIHASKGLEYPVVYVPWTSDMLFNSKARTSFFLADQEVNGRTIKTAHVYAEPTSVKDQEVLYQREIEEGVRLAYVALTRASSRLVVSMSFATTKAKANIQNGYMQGLCADDFAAKTKVKADQVNGWLLARLEEIKKAVDDSNPLESFKPDVFGEGLSLERPASLVEITQTPSEAKTIVRVPEFVSQLSAPESSAVYPDWYRSSFSSISKKLFGARHQADEYEAEESVVETQEMHEIAESSSAIEEEGLEARNAGAETILSFFKGAEVGNWLHQLFEDVFNSPDDSHRNQILTALPERLKKAYFMHARSEEEIQAAADLTTNMVENVLEAVVLPTEGGFGDFRFKDLELSARQNEMDFVLSAKNSNLTMRSMLRTLAENGIGLGNVQTERLNGYFTGAIDMVMYAHDRYWVVDWKSNFIGSGVGADYTAQNMKEEIDRKNYRLQYVIYLLALKRHLKAVLGLSEDEVWNHIGGALYVFMRGIDKKDKINANGMRNGLYRDCPRAAVDALDRLLEGN